MPLTRTGWPRLWRRVSTITSVFSPRPGTWLAAHHNREPTRHIIGRGDTLTKIARRYQVSLSRLRNYNAIEGDRIQIGQVLEIPGS